MPLNFNFELHCTAGQVKQMVHLVHFLPQKRPKQ